MPPSLLSARHWAAQQLPTLGSSLNFERGLKTGSNHIGRGADAHAAQPKMPSTTGVPAAPRRS
jgi:hypothetical protein